MIWGKKHVKCQKTSTGPTSRYYLAILKPSLRDTFLPKIWRKNVQGLKKHHQVPYVDTT